MIRFRDITDYEIMGSAAMGLPCEESRRKSVWGLCKRIKEAEPQAFEVADDWINRTLSDMPTIPYTEPFGEWWRSHYNYNQVMMARWKGLVDLMGKTEVEVSIYAHVAIGIYTALRSNVPKEYAEPKETTFVDECELTKIFEKLDKIEKLTLFNAKEAFTMDDAAAYTGLSKGYLYRLVSEKRIPYYKGDGGKITYFAKTELTRWLLKHRVSTTEEAQQAAAAYVVNNTRKQSKNKQR